LFGQRLLEIAGLGSQRLYLGAGGLARRVACKPLLTGFKKFLRPIVIQAFRDALTPAQRGDALFATKTFKDNAYLLFCRILTACLAPDVPNDPLGPRNPPLRKPLNVSQGR
jgi:hypothetical protein